MNPVGQFVCRSLRTLKILPRVEPLGGACPETGVAESLFGYFAAALLWSDRRFAGPHWGSDDIIHADACHHCSNSGGFAAVGTRAAVGTCGGIPKVALAA